MGWKWLHGVSHSLSFALIERPCRCGGYSLPFWTLSICRGAIKGCTGQEPTVVGKPSPLMIDYLEKKYGMDRSRICMVGDRLDTDVLFGTDNGLKSVLVLSGVTSEEKLLSPENTITPDFYTDDINGFFAEAKVAETA